MKKRILSLLLAFVMLVGILPSTVMATSESVTSFHPMDYITEDVIFDAIKGANTAKDQITTDLKQINGEEPVFYAKVDEATGAVTWKKTSYQSNIKVEFTSSDSPTYVSVGSGKDIFKLLKRPVATNNDPVKAVVLTAKVSALPLVEGQSKEVALNLTIQPGAYIKTAFDYVKEGLFDSIKGSNTAADNITGNLPFQKEKNPAFIKVNSDGTLSWQAYTYTCDVEVNFLSSSHPEILEIPTGTTPSGILFKGAPTTTTEVTIQTKLTLKKDTSVTENFALKLTAPGSGGSQPGSNMLDIFTEDFLFDAIKGTNTSKDNITANFVFPANENNPFYAKLNEDGSFKQWWASKPDTSVKVELTQSSDTALISIVGDGAKINAFPQTDTVVQLTFAVTEVADITNTKNVVIPVTLKAQSPQGNVLDVITDTMLFDAIKGANTDKNSITENFSFPPNGSDNPFFAKLNEDGYFKQWWASQSGAAIKIELTESSNTTLIAVTSSGAKINQFPDIDTKVDLTFTVTEVKNTSNTKTIVIPVTLKAAAAPPADDPIVKKLQGYLEQYLTPERIAYTTIEREGVVFGADYASGNVRYHFTLPNIGSEAGYGWGKYTNTITSKDEAALKMSSKYVAEPIRADVGGQAKRVTLTYTLEAEGKSASKDFTVTIPALTQVEIEEELAVAKKIKEQFFTGIQYNNYDKDNVTDSLKMFQEVNYDVQQNLTFEQSANNKKYYGFKLPSNKSFEITYPNNDPAVFSTTNLVLESRPKTDTVAVISNTVSSILMEKYATLYSGNADLQKLVNIPVSATVTVKAVNPNVISIRLGEATYTVQDGDTGYTLLTNATLTEVPVTVDLANKGAKLVLDGTDMGHVHSKTIALTNGFSRFGIKVSDEDKMQSGTRKEKAYNLAVVSKAYLDAEIAKLPANVQTATSADVQRATALLEQYDLLAQNDKAKIADSAKLEGYRAAAGDSNETYRKQVAKVCEQLFSGIKGANTSEGMVFTDMEEIGFAKLTQEGVIWSKEASDSDVQIVWQKSSQPTYIDVHDGNDFGSAYVKAFKVKQRPARNGKDIAVTFYAKVTHLKNTQISQEATVPFTLKAYNASLKGLTIDQIPTFQFDGKTDYEVVCNSALKQANLQISPAIPNVTITVDGVKLADTQTVQVNLATLPKTVKIKVNDMVKNTLNEKWDEKIYNITFTQTQSTEVDKRQLQAKYAEAIAIDQTIYEQGGVAALNLAIANAKTVLEDAGALQSAVNTALDQLVSAIRGLVELPNADKSELIAELEKTLHLQKTAYTQQSFRAVETAMEEALRLVVKPYVQPSEVTAMLSKLHHAVGSLQTAEKTALSVQNGVLTVSEEKAFTTALGTELANLTVNMNACGALQLSGSRFPAITAKYQNMQLSIPSITAAGNLQLPVAMTQAQLAIATNKLMQKEIDPDASINVFAGYSFAAVGAISDKAEMLFAGMGGKSALWIAEDGSVLELSTQIVDSKNLKVVLPALTGALIIYVKNQQEPTPDVPTEPTTKTVTISIDKETIGGGYVLAPTQATLYKNDTVWSVLKRIAKDNGIRLSYRNDGLYGGTYIAAINGVGEFDHGQGSGWMYCVDGVYPDHTCDKYNLTGGEEIRWRYTTNLGSDLEPGASGSLGGGSSKPEISKPIEPSVTIQGDSATATVTDKNVNDAIDAAKKGGADAIVIAPTGTEMAKEVTVEIPKIAAQSIVKDTNAALNIQTDKGTISIPNDALKSIIEQATGGNLAISIAQKTSDDIKDTSVDTKGAVIVEITVKSGKREIADFGGKSLTISMPAGDKHKAGNNYKIIAISTDGKIEVMSGKCVTEDRKPVIQVTTPHLTTFVATTEKFVAFTDITGHWAYDAIAHVSTKGLMGGVGHDKFDPDGTLNRAMLVAILYRLENSPAVTAANPFSDVVAGQWYTDAVIWASENKIISGVGEGKFAPSANITREQMATMLYNYAQYKKYDVSKSNELTSFTDGAAVSTWALNAIKWANAEGLITGRTAHTIVSAGTAIRAEAATILVRFVENVAN